MNLILAHSQWPADIGVQFSQGNNVRIAYLINRYPAPSHSFIRREIQAVEEAGIQVRRFSIRRTNGQLPDPQDREEAALTTNILGHGTVPIVLAAARMMVIRPARFLSALSLAVRAFAKEPRHGWRHLVYLAEACWLAWNLADIEHLHAHFGTNPASVARLVRILTGIPYSFTVHGPDEFDAPIGLDLNGKIADAHTVMAISSFGRSQLMRWSAPADWNKLLVVRCGVDQAFTDEPAVCERNPSKLCCVARLSAQKGLPLLIDAARRVAAIRPDFSLVLVGDGEMRTEIEEMIAAHGLQKVVTITGYVDSATVRSVLATSWAMVLPSFAEGLPVVVMEALALRTPVIVTAIAGTPELVDDDCGWLIPAGSVDALTGAMVAALAQSGDAMAAKGNIGRRRVLQSHDSVRNGCTMAKLFQSWQ